MFSYTILSFLFLVVQSQDLFYPKAISYFVNSKVFVDGRMRLLWNYTQTSIIGELHVKTNGWVGFGLSPNGGMDGSDVFVAWINDNGSVNFTDRYINSNRQVLIDKQQDWHLLKSLRNGSFLIIQFTRNITTCDPNGQDRDIEEGTPWVIYAWNDAIPTGDISFHGASNRGTSALTLLTALNQQLKITAADMIETYDYNVNVTVPAMETYYHCHMFKIPQNFTTKRHLIRTITKLTPGNENYVHHWLMYQCGPAFETQYLASNKSLPSPGNCFDNEITNSNNSKNTWNTIHRICNQITLVWAIGGDLVIDFPNGLGFPIGGIDAEFKYFYLEVHYNNPELRSNIIDQSGIQLIVTQNLRPTEIGVFTNGAQSTWVGILLAPGQASQSLKYYCRANCLNNLNQGENITIFAVAPHTHTVGTGIVTTIIRNGSEVAYIHKNLNFDFNYQYINFLQKPVILRPGDEIQTTCTYRTTTRTSFTLGGISTSNEMCLSFLYYYPRRPNTGGCLSNAENWDNFFTTLYYAGSLTFSKYPPDFNSLGFDLQNLKNDSNTINLVKSFIQTANQTQACIANGTVTVTTMRRLTPIPLVEKQNNCPTSGFSPQIGIKSKIYFIIIFASLSLY